MAFKLISAELWTAPAPAPVELEDPSLNSIYATSYSVSVNKYIQAWEQEVQQRSNWLKSLALQALTSSVKTELIQDVGNAGRIICQTALNWPADLIILGRRGHTGISELLLGSVSNYVLHHSPCSVLTIPGFVSPATHNPESR